MKKNEERKTHKNKKLCFIYGQNSRLGTLSEME